MPATLEIACENDECELDMAELHYTYDMPADVTIDDFQARTAGSRIRCEKSHSDTAYCTSVPVVRPPVTAGTADDFRSFR
nr:hypothetical protein [Haloplanus sp. HW8-1]